MPLSDVVLSYMYIYRNISPRRIQPSPSFSLVVEVHAARDLDVHAQEVFKLAPCGWAQMQLFDQFNQVKMDLLIDWFCIIASCTNNMPSPNRLTEHHYLEKGDQGPYYKNIRSEILSSLSLMTFRIFCIAERIS